MEPDDLILDWLAENDPHEGKVTGHHTIEYTPGIYVVLETRDQFRPRYKGWFCVTKNPLSLASGCFELCCEKDGMFLYRATHDRLPEKIDT